MKKKKLISLLVVVALLLCSTVTTFAWQKSYYSTYTCLGDSIPSFDITKSLKEQETLGFTEIAGLYPSLVKESLGIKTLYHRARSGFATQELRYMLDGSTTLDEYNTLSLSGITTDDLDAQRDTIINEIKKSDLITLNVGSNDIMTYGLIYGFANVDFKTSGLFSGGELSLTGKQIAQLLAQMLVGMNKGYNNFLNNYPQIVKKLRKINPTAKIVLLGLYNPCEDLKIKSTDEKKVGKLASVLTHGVNKTIQAVAKKYNCTYVSTTGIESVLMEKQTTLEGDFTLLQFFYDIHPSFTGHQEIADKIVKAVKPKTIFSYLSSKKSTFGGAIYNGYSW